MVGADRHGAARSLCCILGGRLLQVRWLCHVLSVTLKGRHKQNGKRGVIKI